MEAYRLQFGILELLGGERGRVRNWDDCGGFRGRRTNCNQLFFELFGGKGEGRVGGVRKRGWSKAFLVPPYLPFSSWCFSSPFFKQPPDTACAPAIGYANTNRRCATLACRKHPESGNAARLLRD
jgi:hypothetical protein